MRETLFVRFNTLQFALATGNFVTALTNEKPKKTVSHNLCHAIFYVSDMRKLSTVQNAGFPNIFSFHIIHYTLFSSLKNIYNKKDFHVARQTF